MFLLGILLQTLILERVFSLPLLDGEEPEPGVFFYQYAVLLYNTSYCHTCQKTYEANCKQELLAFVHNDFPDYTVELVDRAFLCGVDNGLNIVLLRLHLTPTGKQDASSTKLQRMLECSGHLPSVTYFESCSFYTANSPTVQSTSTIDTDLIAVLVTVFVTVALLVLAVLMYRKRKEVAALAKRWSVRCRCHHGRRDDERETGYGSITSTQSNESQLEHIIDELRVIVENLRSPQSSQSGTARP